MRRHRAKQRLAIAHDVIRNEGDIAACASRSKCCTQYLGASARNRRVPHEY